jgi:hypothetical protein
MATSIEELEARIRGLPIDQQRELLGRLNRAIDPMSPEIRAAWIAETELRVEAIRAGRAVLHDGESVIAEARERLNAKLQNR